MQLLYGLLKKSDIIESPVYTLTDQDYQRDVPSIEAINRELSRTLDINGTPVFEPGAAFNEIFDNKTDHKLTQKILSTKLGVEENSFFIRPFFDGIGLYAIAMTRYTQIEKGLYLKSPDLQVTASNQDNSRFNLTFSKDKTILTSVLKLEVNFVKFIDNNPPHIELTVKITVRRTTPEITRETSVKCNFSHNTQLLEDMKPLEIFKKTEKALHKKDIDNSIRECIRQSITQENEAELKEKKTKLPRDKQRLFTLNQLRHLLEELKQESLNPKNNDLTFDLEKFRNHFFYLFSTLTTAHTQELIPGKKKLLNEFLEIIRLIIQIGTSPDDLQEPSELSKRLVAIEASAKNSEEILSQLHRFLSENLPHIIKKQKTQPSSAAVSTTVSTTLSDTKFASSFERETKLESNVSEAIAEKVYAAQCLRLKYQFKLFEKRLTSSGDQPATFEYVFSRFNPLQQARLPSQIPLLETTSFDHKLQQSLESLNLLPKTLILHVHEYTYENDSTTLEDLQLLHKQYPQIFPNLDNPLQPEQIQFYGLISTLFTTLLNIAEGHQLDTSPLVDNAFSILQSQIFNKSFNAFQRLRMMRGIQDRSQQFEFQNFLDDLCIFLDHVLVEISNTQAIELLKIQGIKSATHEAVTTDQIKQALDILQVHYAYIDQRQNHWVVFMWPTEAYKAALLISIEKCQKSLKTPSTQDLQTLNQLKSQVLSRDLSTISASQFPDCDPFIRMKTELQTLLKSSVPAPGYSIFQFLNQNTSLPKPQPHDSKKKTPPQQPSKIESTFFHYSESATWIIVNSFKTAVLLKYQAGKKSTHKKTLAEQKADFIARLKVTILQVTYNHYDGYKLLVPRKNAESTHELIESEISKNLDYAYRKNKQDAKKIPRLIEAVISHRPASFTQKRLLVKILKDLTPINWDNPELIRLKNAIDSLISLQYQASQPPVNRELLAGLATPINELTTTYNLTRRKIDKDKKPVAETTYTIL